MAAKFNVWDGAYGHLLMNVLVSNIVCARICEKLFTLLDLCVSSLRRGHANLLCIVPILTDDPRRESIGTYVLYVYRSA